MLSNVILIVNLVEMHLLQVFQSLFQVALIWHFMSSKIYVVLLLNKEYPQAEYDKYDFYCSWDMLVTEFSGFDP